MKYHHYTEYIREQENLISQKRWSEMLDYDDKSEANYSIIRQIIQYKLLRVEPFTQEVYDTYCRIYGPSDRIHWSSLLSCMLPPPSLSTLQFINQSNDINWNSDSVVLPIIMRVLISYDPLIDTNSYLDHLLANGANINLQASYSHQSILYGYILHSLQTNDHVIRPEQIKKRISYLLEHGADPLLPDRHGKTILSVLEDADQYSYVHPSLKEELIALLQVYA